MAERKQESNKIKNDMIDYMHIFDAVIGSKMKVLVITSIITILSIALSFAQKPTTSATAEIEIGTQGMPNIKCEQDLIIGLICKNLSYDEKIKIEEVSQLINFLAGEFGNRNFSFDKKGGQNLLISYISSDLSENPKVSIMEAVNLVLGRHDNKILNLISDRKKYFQYISSKEKSEISLITNQINSKETRVKNIKETIEFNEKLIRQRYNFELIAIENNLQKFREAIEQSKVERVFREKNIKFMESRIKMNEKFLDKGDVVNFIEHPKDRLALLQENIRFKENVLKQLQSKKEWEFTLSNVEEKSSMLVITKKTIIAIRDHLDDNHLTPEQEKENLLIILKSGRSILSPNNLSLIFDKLLDGPADLPNLDTFKIDLDILKDQVYSLTGNLEELEFDIQSLNGEKNNVKFTVFENLKEDYNRLILDTSYQKSSMLGAVKSNPLLRNNQNMVFLVGLLFGLLISITYVASTHNKKLN